MRRSAFKADVGHGTKPKYSIIYQKMRQRILAGEYQPGMRLPPERKLPGMLGASLQTTRLALGQLVREGLIVRRHGSGTYIADKRLPEIIPGRSMRIGILWHHRFEPEDFESSQFVGQMLQGIFSVLHLDCRNGLWPNIKQGMSRRAEFKRSDNSVLAICLGETRISQVQHPPMDEVRSGKFDGLLSLGIVNEPWLEELLTLGVPTILLDHLNDRFDLRADQVFFDPGPGYRAAIHHLVSKGFKCIHYIGGLTSIPAPSPLMNIAEVRAFRAGQSRIDPDSYLRMSACKQALDALKIPLKENYVHHISDDDAACEALATRLLAYPSDERPDAILCHASSVAHRIQSTFERKGHPLSAFGATFDKNMRGLIRADAEHMGATAAELLISHWQRPGRRVVRVGIPMEFVPPSAEQQVG